MGLPVEFLSSFQCLSIEIPIAASIKLILFILLSSSDPKLTQTILLDAALLCLFVVQHSCMACDSFRRFCDGLSMVAILRPLYILSTCFVIQVCVYVE